MARPKTPINLTSQQTEILQRIARSRETPHSLVVRTHIILKAASGLNNKTISQELGLCKDTIGLWRKRWIEGSQNLDKLAQKPEKLTQVVKEIFQDKPRPGSPGKFEAEQICQVMALACETPPEYLSHWTRKELVTEIINRGIVDKISATTVGRFLKSSRSSTTSK